MQSTSARKAPAADAPIQIFDLVLIGAGLFLEIPLAVTIGWTVGEIVITLVRHKTVRTKSLLGLSLDLGIIVLRSKASWSKSLLGFPGELLARVID